MSRKTTFAVAALLSLAVAGAAMAQGTKADSTKKAPAGKMMKKSTTKSTKADTGKKMSKGMKKGGTMKKDSTAKKP